MANKLFSSPPKKIKRKRKKTSFNFITTISQWSWVKNAKLIRVQPQRNALTLLMAVNFALKKKKKKEERKKEKRGKFFSEEIDRSLFYS